jgi:Domain of unknown function (DUF4124)
LCLLLPLAAHAQMYQCRDARGVMQFSDKPFPNCKTEKASTPAPVRERPVPSAAKPAAKSAVVEDPVRFASRCKTLREERDWLLSPRGKVVEAHAARVAQVDQALRACP